MNLYQSQSTFIHFSGITLILDENVSWFSRGKKEKVDNRPAKLNEKKRE